MSRLHDLKVKGHLPMGKKERKEQEAQQKAAERLEARARAEGMPPELMKFKEQLEAAEPKRAVATDMTAHERAAGCYWARLAKANPDGTVPPAKCATSKRYGQVCLLEAGLDCEEYRV